MRYFVLYNEISIPPFPSMEAFMISVMLRNEMKMCMENIPTAFVFLRYYLVDYKCRILHRCLTQTNPMKKMAIISCLRTDHADNISHDRLDISELDMFANGLDSLNEIPSY